MGNGFERENNFAFKNDILQGMSLVNLIPKKVFLVNKKQN